MLNMHSCNSLCCNYVVCTFMYSIYSHIPQKFFDTIGKSEHGQTMGNCYFAVLADVTHSCNSLVLQICHIHIYAALILTFRKNILTQSFQKMSTFVNLVNICSQTIVQIITIRGKGGSEIGF